MPSELDLLNVVRPVVAEAEARPVRRSRISVLEYEPTDLQASTHLVWAGSLGVFVARRGSQVLKDIRKAVKSRDGSDLKIAERIGRQMEAKGGRTLAQAIELLRAQPVFADVSYCGRLVAASLFLFEDLEVFPMALPYNGGKIVPEGFTLVEHYQEDSDAELEALILKREPPLTAVERAALNKIPASQHSLNVGSAAMCWAVSAVAIASLVCTMSGLCCGVTSEKRGLLPDAGHLVASKIKALGPGATARELLRLRREILEAGRR